MIPCRNVAGWDEPGVGQVRHFMNSFWLRFLCSHL